MMTETIKDRELLNLTPAESLMIIDPKRSKGKEMMKLTFIDLLLKRVLKADVIYEDVIYKGVIYSTTTDTKLKWIYIIEGENYSKAKLKPHEHIFTRAELFSPKLLLRWFAKELYRSIAKFSIVERFFLYKKNFVRNSLIADGYFHTEAKKFLFLFPYTKYVLSEKGLSAQTKITNLLEEGAKEFERWVKHEPARAKAYLSVCGSNILLLEHYNYDLKIIQEWIKALSKIESQENSSDCSFP